MAHTFTLTSHGGKLTSNPNANPNAHPNAHPDPNQENEKLRKVQRKKEARRVEKLVERAYENDPRVKRHALEEKEGKVRAKAERH